MIPLAGQIVTVFSEMNKIQTFLRANTSFPLQLVFILFLVYS